MKTLTLKNQPVAERIMERREQFFAQIEGLTDEQIADISFQWHQICNRYMRWIAISKIRSLTGAEN